MGSLKSQEQFPERKKKCATHRIDYISGTLPEQKKKVAHTGLTISQECFPERKKKGATHRIDYISGTLPEQKKKVPHIGLIVS